MGFFDDFNNLVGEISSIKSEMTNIKNGFIDELHSEATGVAQTIDDTATDLRHTAVEMSETVKQSTTLTPSEPPTSDDDATAS